MTKFLQGQEGFWRPELGQARVPERLIGVNPGLKLFPFLYFTILCIAWGNIFCYHYCTSSKGSTFFVTSSCMFLDEKTVLEIWLNPGLNFTMFRETGPRSENGCKKNMTFFYLK